MIDENKLIDLTTFIELLELEINKGEELGFDRIGMDFETAKQIVKLLKQLKVGEWIPVEERLPEEPEQNPKLDDRPMELYLVDIGEDYPFRAFWNGRYFHDGMSRLDVIAWQPLQEPYSSGTRKNSKKS